jgi:5-methylcytosine-specific restriction enzyme A
MTRTRTEFSKKVKVAAFERSQGHCECCTARLWAGKVHYDHRIPDAQGGEPTLENCQVLCVPCHTVKTAKDAADTAKAKRREARHIGAHRSARPMPGSKASGLRKRMNGKVEKRT